MPKGKEIQDEPAGVKVEAGISNLQTVYKCGSIVFPLALTVTVPTKKRGVHMSRLVGAVLRNTEGRDIEDALRQICREVNMTQDGCRVRAEFHYPLGDQFMDVMVELRETGQIKYSFRKLGITACPCSKEECGLGHMQRSHLRLELLLNTVIDFVEVARKLDSCFSATLSEHLKRDQEASKILEAQARPRFVEDLVRECLLLFPEAQFVEARSHESIHAHDAIAFWRKN